MTTKRNGQSAYWFYLLFALVLQPSVVPAAQLRIFGWGDSFYGQTNVPASLTNVFAVAAGYYHGLALRSNGTVISWGDNTYGQTNNQPTLTNAIAIDGGGYHSVALRSNGLVYCWGQNTSGQCNPPASLSGVKAVSAGASHTMALRTNGLVVAWGSNASGQTNVPPNATNVVAISAGDSHCLALRANGTVVAWGDNGSGQSTVPANVTNITAIAAGYHHNLAVRSNGTVVAWGVNVYGETSPPPGLSNVIAVAAGYFHSAALKNDGTVVAWGQEFSGVTNVPVGLNSVTALVAGWEFDLALSSSALCPPGLPDDFDCRQILAGSSISNLISNVGATREVGEPQHFTAPTSNSIWFTWTAPSSGGVVVTVSNNDFNLPGPVLAVYTGDTLANLVRQSSNSADFYVARTAFTAVAGQPYQIVVDGRNNAQGNMVLKLDLSPPPLNDLFANGTAIAGNFYESSGSFIGASHETSEPDHGDPSLGQTLWWNWTAPTNGPSPLSIRLLADAVSFPPGLGVYTGNSVASLTPVTLTKKTNGMSSDATFNAAPGTTYRIALAGKQNDPDSTAALVGNYRFRLNCRAIALTITNFTSTTNTVFGPHYGEVTFQANALIQNLSSSASKPLRVSVSAISGLSTTRPLTAMPVSIVTNLGIFPPTPTNLAAGQTALIPINGIVPGPNIADQSTPIAYGAYAALQEQPAANQWFSVDETLVTFDKWPAIGEVVGPGGGVIRLDPGYVGASAFNPLTSVMVVGSPTVIEGSPASYFGQARYASGFQFNFTNTVWLASLFKIATNGVFSPGIVNSNTPVTLTAKFSASGFNYDAPTNVTVINLPSPTLKQVSRISTNFIFQIAGVSNRVHVVEATTDLSPPQVWLPLGTNTLSATGLWNFTNIIGTIPQRFYRAREVE